MEVERTGLAEDGEYITIDHNKTDIYHDPYSEYFFIYGVGGAYGKSIPWQTVATSDSSLKPGDKIVIEIYPGKIFEVTDTGTALGEKHLDVFVGAIDVQKKN